MEICNVIFFILSVICLPEDKTLERLVDRHIRDDVLGRNPLHINQHAYQSGKSTDTVLNSVVSTIKKALETQKIALGPFFDIDGTFY